MEKEKLTIEEEKARTLIEIAEKLAAELVMKTKDETQKMIVGSIKQAFGEGEEEKKIMLMNRVPYICEDIKQIKADQQKIMWGVLATVGLYILGKLLKVI